MKLADFGAILFIYLLQRYKAQNILITVNRMKAIRENLINVKSFECFSIIVFINKFKEFEYQRNRECRIVKYFYSEKMNA